jgi:hypothetical protein
MLIGLMKTKHSNNCTVFTLIMIKKFYVDMLRGFLYV